MKKPVIFIDFGGVYFTNATPPAAREFSRKYKIPQKKIFDAIFGANWKEYAEGRSNEKKYWKGVSDTLHISKEQAEELRRMWYSYSELNDGMEKLVEDLRKKYVVAALSSITTGWVKLVEKKYKVSGRFHQHHYSYDHGIDKPDEEFFLSAARKMKAKPEDCIVIDDMKKFLVAVKKTGARTILFKNAKQLEKDLKKLGVEI